MSDKSKFDKDYELLRIAVFWSLLPKTLKNIVSWLFLSVAISVIIFFFKIDPMFFLLVFDIIRSVLCNIFKAIFGIHLALFGIYLSALVV